MLAHDPLLSALLRQQVDPPLNTSDVNPHPLPQILAFTLQRYVLTLQTLSACSPPPPLSVSSQVQGNSPLLPSTVRTYVTRISVLLLREGVPLCQPSYKPTPLPQLSPFPLQQVAPPLQPLAVSALLLLRSPSRFNG